jgi:hypothetical protein
LLNSFIIFLPNAIASIQTIYPEKSRANTPPFFGFYRI